MNSVEKVIGELEGDIERLRIENLALKKRIQELEKNGVQAEPSELDMKGMYHAKIQGSPSTEAAITNDIYYNPGYPFKESYIAPRDVPNRHPRRVVYDATIEEGTMGLNMYTRLDFGVSMNEMVWFKPMEKPTSIDEVTLDVDTINRTKGYVLSNEQIMETITLLEGQTLAMNRTSTVKLSDETVVKLTPTRMVPYSSGILVHTTKVHL